MPQTAQQKLIHMKLGGQNKKLTSSSLGLEKHLTKSGKFTQVNPRSDKEESVLLERISTVDPKKNKFALHGTSKKDGRTITKIVTVK